MTRVDLVSRIGARIGRCSLIAAVLTFAGGFASPSARADVTLIPPPETGPKTVNLTKVGNTWEMRDAQSNKLIMQERNAVPQTQVWDTLVQRVVEIRPQPTGYDMVVTFSNPTDQARPAGALYAGMFTLGPSVTYFDFRYGSQPVQADFATYVGQQFNYPDSQYAPVWVFMNGEYAVGVSILYPMLSYEHDLRIGLMNPTGSNDGEGGKGWGISAKISNKGTEPWDQQLPFSAMIPPGQERTYVLCVRVSHNPGEWARTLLPYRRYFRESYGGVTYRREGKPLQPVVIAENSYLEPSNKLGFTYIASRRPDVFGWKPWADALKQAPKGNIQMLWAPSGIYYEQAALNFPFQMTTHWQSDPKLATALDPVIGLKAVGSAGVPLGLWWGRSVEVATEWEPAEMPTLDVTDSAQREIAFREMDLAVQAGVTVVGLDTFSPGRVQLARLYMWLHDLRERYPTVRFIVEPNACDLLHSLAGSFISGWKDATNPGNIEGLYRVNVPHALADFLLPGHETFLAFRYNGYREYFNINPTPELIQQDMEKFAAMGFTPAIFEELGGLPTVQIARTWETTVPADLRLSPAVHPLKSDITTALGSTFRPTDRDTGSSSSRGSDNGATSSSGVSTFTRAVLAGGSPAKQAPAKNPESGSAESSVNTIVNGGGGGRGAAPGSPSSVQRALTSSSRTNSSVSEALNRAGFFGALSGKAAGKGSKSKTASGPIKVVTSKTSGQPSQTASADKDAAE
ncbi:MAG: hypothetical protein IT435_11320 [Phycisphaerales bacterium]|nr:hypothetical protein [Phycisphaerales bacterium]